MAGVGMRLIFSRKGFDTQNGGVPSPILPDGRMCSLPIPDSSSQVRYSDILWDDVSLGKVVSDLTGNRIRGTTRAHLDPDINPAALRLLSAAPGEWIGRDVVDMLAHWPDLARVLMACSEGGGRDVTISLDDSVE